MTFIKGNHGCFMMFFFEGARNVRPAFIGAYEMMKENIDLKTNLK